MTGDLTWRSVLPRLAMSGTNDEESTHTFARAKWWDCGDASIRRGRVKRSTASATQAKPSQAKVFESQTVFLCRCDEMHSHKARNAVRPAKGDVLHPNWRMLPQQFDLPASSQIFGRIAAAAGIHGILYPSSRHVAKRCLALFPQNWAGSGSFVQVSDEAPEGAQLTRIDGLTREII